MVIYQLTFESKYNFVVFPDVLIHQLTMYYHDSSTEIKQKLAFNAYNLQLEMILKVEKQSCLEFCRTIYELNIDNY